MLHQGVSASSKRAGEPVTLGYTTAAGFIAAQDEQGWYDTGDLGCLPRRATSWSAVG